MIRKLASTIIALSLLTQASAESLDVSVGSFQDPSGFNLVSSDVGFRFSELSSVDDVSSTHMLLEGLSPISDSSTVVTGNYKAINVDSGETRDVGVVYLDLPSGAALPEGTVASPIVGVVERDQPWSGYNPVTPSETTVGESSGSGDYTPNDETISVTLNRGGDTFTGNLNYSVIDKNTLSIEPFTLAVDGTTSYDFDGATMFRDGGRFYGTIASTDSSVNYDSLLFTLEMTNIPDADGDGIPDISDSEVEKKGVNLDPGNWILHDSLGWLYGYNDKWAHSQSLGIIYTVAYPWVYHRTFGYLRFHSRINESFTWYYSQSLGWIFIGDENGGWFQYESDNWAWDNFHDPQGN